MKSENKMQKLFSKRIQTFIFVMMIGLFGASTSFAQVSASFGDVTGRPGETASVAVQLSGVESAAAIQSFNFNVSVPAGVTFTGVTTTNSLAGTAGFTVGANPANGSVGGFSTGTNITASGNLIYLNFSLVTAGAGTVTLSGITVNATAVPNVSSSATVSNRIIAIQSASVGVGSDFEITLNLEDALASADGVISFSADINYDPTLMSVDKSMGQNGVVKAGTLSSGGTVNGNDVDANTYRVSGFAGSAITGSGVLVKLAAKAATTAGVGAFTLSNVVFNAGTPVYASRPGTLTVNAVNFPPVFTAALANTAVVEDSGVFTFDYNATDANSTAVTFALTAGPGSIVPATGVYTVDPAGKSGVHTVTVTATDGVNTTSTSATLTIHKVDLLEATLSGFNSVAPTATVAIGKVSFRMVAGLNTLTATFAVADLAGDLTASHIHLGGVGMNGGVSLNLAPASAYFTKTYDITGMADLVTAMRAGNAYVNVHSSAYPNGEIRGQVLGAANVAPSEAALQVSSSVVIAGAPTAGLIPVSWVPVTDPNGNKVNYILQMATDAAFSQSFDLMPFGVTNGFLMSVGDAAMLFDQITNRAPGNVDIGGSATIYLRVITTDGSLWNAGPGKSLTLTRGLVTDTENEGQLPTEFSLKGNYPNPFNPSTTISFDLPETADVSVQVLDLLGREVMAIPAQAIEAGASRSIQINASSLSSGVYLYRVFAQGVKVSNSVVGTMTLLK
jgi:hypothetical protein